MSSRISSNSPPHPSSRSVVHLRQGSLPQAANGKPPLPQTSSGSFCPELAFSVVYRMTRCERWPCRARKCCRGLGGRCVPGGGGGGSSSSSSFFSSCPMQGVCATSERLWGGGCGDDGRAWIRCEQWERELRLKERERERGRDRGRERERERERKREREATVCACIYIYIYTASRHGYVSYSSMHADLSV